MIILSCASNGDHYVFADNDGCFKAVLCTPAEVRSLPDLNAFVANESTHKALH